MFIVSLIYKVELSEVDKYLASHIEYLNKYFAAGIFIMSGRKLPRDGGVILAKASNKDDLITILNDDPFKVHDLAEYTVQEFVPTLVADGLGFLQEK